MSDYADFAQFLPVGYESMTLAERNKYWYDWRAENLPLEDYHV